MDPFVATIKEVIDCKIKNLHPDVEGEIIQDVLLSGLSSRVKIVKFIRSKLSLPSQGSNKKIYWIRRGWSNEDAEKLRLKNKMPSSPMKIENWLSKINPVTRQNYSREEAEFKIKSFRKLNKEYWTSRGYTDEDAIYEVSKYQKENSKIFIQKMIDNPSDYTSRVPTQIGYYLKKGYSDEESKQMLKKRQSKTTLESFIERYGEYDGTLKYNINVKNIGYISSRKYYLDKYGNEEGNKIYDDRILRRITPMSKSSKESFRFLLKIYKFLRRNVIDKNDIYMQ